MYPANGEPLYKIKQYRAKCIINNTLTEEINMKNSIIINGKQFKQTTISDKYYVSKDGEVYSTQSRKIIKGSVFVSKGKQYRRIDIKKKHYTVHRLVFEAWVRPLNDGEQVNHKDDDSLNNTVHNLYAGNQKDNIDDCIKNQHRVGNVFYLTVFDKQTQKTITFCPAYKFIEYCGHPNKSGSLNKFFNKNWFKKQYDIIEFKHIGNLENYKSVTTNSDECKNVG